MQRWAEVRRYVIADAPQNAEWMVKSTGEQVNASDPLQRLQILFPGPWLENIEEQDKQRRGLQAASLRALSGSVMTKPKLNCSAMRHAPSLAREGDAGCGVAFGDVLDLCGQCLKAKVLGLIRGGRPAGQDGQGQVAGVSFAVLDESHFQELHFGGAGGAYDASGTGVD
jgi:hypothetical protein